MKSIRLVIPVGPKPQKRPRVYRNKHTGNVHAVSPKAEHKDALACIARNRPEEPIDKTKHDAITAKVIFYLGKPKSASKKHLYPNTKPDLDNLEKFLFDALEKYGYYTNDSRITDKIVCKRFSNDGQPPRTIIELSLKE